MMLSKVKMFLNVLKGGDRTSSRSQGKFVG